MTSILANANVGGTVGMLVWLCCFIWYYVFPYDPSTEEGAEEKRADAQ